jgi:hypothetical protein
MSEESPIFCARCLAPVKLMIDASWVSTIVCPSCGESDSLENAFKQIDEYIGCYVRGELTHPTEPSSSGPQPRSFRFVPRNLVRGRRSI